MQTISQCLQQYATAMSDPTRAMILLELDHAGELTATQLARRLGLTANNVYHHMRVLRRLSVVSPPRAVAGDTYVEKYYRIDPELQSALKTAPKWLDQIMSTATSEDRKEMLISICITMAHLLHRAARRYRAMDAAELDRMAYQQQLAMVSINEMSRDQFTARLAGLRELLASEEERYATNDAATTDVVLIATLPLLWERPESEVN